MQTESNQNNSKSEQIDADQEPNNSKQTEANQENNNSKQIEPNPMQSESVTITTESYNNQKLIDYICNGEKPTVITKPRTMQQNEIRISRIHQAIFTPQTSTRARNMKIGTNEAPI